MEVEVRTLQMELIELLKAIDSYCKKHQIEYSLDWGTLLGAIRHKGFIPWDDDIDICMTRDNYQKLVNSWNVDPIDGLFLQNTETDPEFHSVSAKIQKINSTYIEYDFQKKLKHTGIFVDIFILDRVHERGLLRIIDWIEWTVYFVSIKGRFTYRLSSERRIDKFTLKALSRYRIWFQNRLIVRSAKKELPFNEMNGYKQINRRFPPSIINCYTEMEFEGSCFPVMSGWDIYLRQGFGDYMRLPPVEERTWKHHPIILDLNKRYVRHNEE